MVGEIYIPDLPNTSFIKSTVFDIVNQSDDSDIRVVFLISYRSDLGSQFKIRKPNSKEMQEIKAICRYLRSLALNSEAGDFDDYFIEFADGAGDLKYIDPSRRTVFGFTKENGCDADPDNVSVS